MNNLTVKDGNFELDGKPFRIYSGAMHYFRIPKEYWHDRLLKLKLCGLNTVETYCAWNMHEIKEGEFCFEDMADIATFIKTAQDLGLYVIVRPGPYICAEWDFGGLPAYFMKKKNVRIRCNDSTYLAYVERYYAKLMEQISPYLAKNGGNIIAMQVENEYGSYGNDKKYLKSILEIMKKVGMDTFLFTSDGGNDTMIYSGTLDEVLPTLNFGSNAKGNMEILSNFRPNAPRMCTEFWCGWFDHFGEKHHTRGSNSILKEIRDFVENDCNFNMYMFHGGTNFGFMAGANYTSYLQPTITSYDYCAPLNEYGDYTPQYHAIREYMQEVRGLKLDKLPPSPKVQNIGEVKLSKVTSLWDNIDNIATKHYSPMPETMEHFDQNYGLIYYKTKINGRYDAGFIKLDNMRDRAYIYYNGELKAKLEAPLVSKVGNIFKRKLVKKSCFLPKVTNGIEIGVLVDALGRVNYGHMVGKDAKGMTAMRLNNYHIMDYDVYTMPLDNLDKLDFSKSTHKYPIFMKGEFTTNSKADCFIDIRGFTKGYVFVNGRNIGRYWNVGPQKTLYLPGCWLKEKNEIIVLELDGTSKTSISIIDKHILG